MAAGALFYRTHDAGKSWEIVDLPEPEQGYFADPAHACGTYWPFFLNEKEGWVNLRCLDMLAENLTELNYLYHTKDGGQSWIIDKYPGGELYFLDDSTGWVLGRDLYQSRNGGENWQKIKTVTWDGKFNFVDEQLGWAAARSETEFGLVKRSTEVKPGFCSNR